MLKKRFVFVLMLGMTFASPTALADSTKPGEQKLSQTNMAGVRCGSEFMQKKLDDRTAVPTEKKVEASRAMAAR